MFYFQPPYLLFEDLSIDILSAWEVFALEFPFRCFPQLCNTYDITTIRKTLAEIDEQGVLRPDGTLLVYVALWLEYLIFTVENSVFSPPFDQLEVYNCSGDLAIGVIYFRAGYAPTDYPSESVSRSVSFCCCWKF